LAVGCTGGKHRSVAIAEELAARLRVISRRAGTDSMTVDGTDTDGANFESVTEAGGGIDVQVTHRDLGRE
jgi:hypothetical protein